MLRAFLGTWSLIFLLFSFGAHAQVAPDNAEARMFFDEGNELYQIASDASAEHREALLRQALAAYSNSLRIVRNRNALFNAAVVCEELGRNVASFNYYSEYLSIEGLTEQERKQALDRKDAVRPLVAVLRLSSSPAGAKVWIDRKDLAPRGITPLEMALPPGEHRVLIEHGEHVSQQVPVGLTAGTTLPLEITLQPLPEPALQPSASSTSISVSAAPDTLLSLGGTPEDKEELDTDLRRLRRTAIGTGSASLAMLGASIGLTVRAFALKDEYDAARNDPASEDNAANLREQTQRLNWAADASWITTGGLAVSAITTWILYKKRKRQTDVSLDVHVSQGGAFAALRAPLGGKVKPQGFRSWH